MLAVVNLERCSYLSSSLFFEAALRSVCLVFRGKPDARVQKNVEASLLSKHEDVSI